MDLRTTPILASFDAAPPVTLATRSCASSFFSSSSVFSSSLLFLVRSSCALIFIAASRMALAAGGGLRMGGGRGRVGAHALGSRARSPLAKTLAGVCGGGGLSLTVERAGSSTLDRATAGDDGLKRELAPPAPAPALSAPAREPPRRDMAQCVVAHNPTPALDPWWPARRFVARAGTRRRPSGKALYGFFCARLKPTRNRGASLSLSRRSAHLNQPLNKDAASNARQRRRAETRTRGNNRLLAELTP